MQLFIQWIIANLCLACLPLITWGFIGRKKVNRFSGTERKKERERENRKKVDLVNWRFRVFSAIKWLNNLFKRRQTLIKTFISISNDIAVTLAEHFRIAFLNSASVLNLRAHWFYCDTINTHFRTKFIVFIHVRSYIELGNLEKKITLVKMQKNTRKVAPDGGWGWAACFGVSLVNVSIVELSQRNCTISPEYFNKLCKSRRADIRYLFRL